MALNHVKVCSNLFIQEKQIKTTLRSDWQKSTSVTATLRDCEADGHCHALLVGMQMVQA